MSKNKKTVILLLIAAVLIAVVPLFVLKEAEFGGSDDAGSVMVRRNSRENMSRGLLRFWRLR